MNLQLVRTFLEIIECGTFVRAAQQLSVTQSTVTMRLNTLEGLLGQQLLARSKSGTELTAAGHKFKRHAETLIEVWQKAQVELGLPLGFTSVCNIGCHFDCWEGLVGNWVDALRTTHASIALAAWPGDHDLLTEWIGNRRIDAAIGFSTQARSQWVPLYIGDDRLVKVVSGNPDYTADNQDTFYVELGDEFRREYALNASQSNSHAMTFGQSSWALQFLRSHAGCGYLPLRAALPGIKNSSLTVVSGAIEYTRPIYLLHNPAISAQWKWFSNAATELRALCDYYNGLKL